MLPVPLEHRFTINGDTYLLMEYTRGGERRLRQEYSMAIALAPGVIEAMDGADLYAEALARECLKEAPAIWWEEQPAQAGRNGTPARVITCEHIPRAVWVEFRREADYFLGLLFPPLPAAVEDTHVERQGAPDVVETPEAIPAVFRGRAG
jgi:hypothetical protein